MSTLQKINIKYFRSYTEDSDALFYLLKDAINILFKSFDYEAVFESIDAWGLQPTENCPNTSAYRVLESSFSGDIVIVDASIEGEKDNTDFCKNYECLTPAAMNLDNILILSRTQIPLNFLPTRTNVSKLGNDIDIVNPKNDSHGGFRKYYSNKQIVSWATSELTQMYRNEHVGNDGITYNRIFRDPDFSISIADYTNNISNLIQIQEYVFNENSKALSNEKTTKTTSKKCFISYRGCYCTKPYIALDGKGYTIDSVKEAILQESSNAEVVYFKEGALSNEFMPEVRRWGFVSYIDRVIRGCDEFWIFDTKYRKTGSEESCGYWDSWWCLGEILTIMRMSYSLQLKPNFKVVLFDPDKDSDKKYHEIDISHWHKITKEENEELARYYANSDFLEAGYESSGNMRQMRRLPEFILKLLFRRLKKTVYSALGDDYRFETFKKSIYSHVYDESFFSNRIYTVDSEAPKGCDISILSNKNFIWNFLNINGWYSNPNNTSGHTAEPYPGAKVISKNEFNDNLMSKYNIVKDNDDEFYIWWTPRMGRRTGPNNCVVELVELYKTL